MQSVDARVLQRLAGLDRFIDLEAVLDELLCGEAVDEGRVAKFRLGSANHGEREAQPVLQ